MPVEKRCLYQQKISPILGKIFKYIWKSYLALLENSMDSLDFGITLMTQKFFYISTLDISPTVSSKSINHTTFWKNSIGSSTCT